MNILEVTNNAWAGTVYHGSGSRFNKFEQSKARIVNDFYGGGVAYFTDSVPVAITYAKSMAKKTGGEPLVYTVSVSFDRVFDVDNVFTGQVLKDILPDDIEGFARGAGMMGLNADQYKVMASLQTGRAKLTGDQIFKGLSRGMNQTAKTRQHLISRGYDALRYNGEVNMDMATKHNVYLAYDAADLTIKKRQIVRKKQNNA